MNANFDTIVAIVVNLPSPSMQLPRMCA